MSTLIERLTTYAKCDYIHAGYWREDLPTMDITGEILHCMEELTVIHAELTRLRRDNKRLREGLQAIADDNVGCPDCDLCKDCALCVQDYAKSVLDAHD